MLPFLAAKTKIPVLSPNLVSRPHLNYLLDQCLQPGIPLALVSASAGAGKTTLLAGWLDEVPQNWKICWLSLDLEDNQLTRFFSYLTEVIKRSIPGFMSGFTTLIEANQIFTPEQLVTFLIEQLTGVENDLLKMLRQPVRDHHRPQGQHTRIDALGQRHYVRDDVPVLGGKPCAGPAETGHDLVQDEQHAIVVADLA